MAGGTISGFTTLLSSIIINGNVTIGGNLTAAGNVTFANTIFTTTSSLSVINFGPGPAILINQTLAPYDIASFYSGNTEVLHVGTPIISNGRGRIGVNTSFPNYELTVIGSISATQSFITNGNVDAWTATLGNTDAAAVDGEFIPFSVIGSATESVFNRLQNLTTGVSASTDLAIYSDDGVSYVDIGINSSTWDGNLFDPIYNNIGPNDTYLYSENSNLAIGTNTNGFGDIILYTGGTLSGTQAFGGNDRLRILNSGNVGINENNPSVRLTVGGSISSDNVIYSSGGNSSQWNSVYSYVNSVSSIESNQEQATSFVISNSANIISVDTLVNNTSAQWNSVYSYVNSASSIEANQEQVTSFVISNSSNILAVDTLVNNTSANWDISYNQSTIFATNSANYCTKSLALAFAIAL